MINADGSGATLIAQNFEQPAWSPDGKKLAAVRWYPQNKAAIFTMNADGSAVTQITDPYVQGGTYADYDPAWSPDGAKIAFTRDRYVPSCPCFRVETFLMNPDGSGQAPLGTPSEARFPDWAPDGSKILFVHSNNELYTINADGTNVTPITTGVLEPRWSPDGTKIVFEDNPSSQIATMNPDGTGRVLLTHHETAFAFPAWQPIPITAYPRPKGATPTRASLVPAFKPCSAPNEQHGSPLAYGSCTPPVQASDFLTVGTPPQDPANSIGSVVASATSGDVSFTVSVTDVRKKTSLADYTGELETRLPLRITDKNSIGMPGGGTAAGTTQDSSFSFGVPCAATSDPSIGSACSIITSANTLVPGVVAAGQRAIWQFDQIGVYDGGSDGLASTTADNTLFMDEGIFVP